MPAKTHILSFFYVRAFFNLDHYVNLSRSWLPLWLSSPDPYFFIRDTGRFTSANFRLLRIQAFHFAQLRFPYIQLVISTVCCSREYIEWPFMFWAGKPSTKNDAEIFNVEWRALWEGVRRMRAFLVKSHYWLPKDTGIWLSICLDV